MGIVKLKDACCLCDGQMPASTLGMSLSFLNVYGSLVEIVQASVPSPCDCTYSFSETQYRKSFTECSAGESFFSAGGHGSPYMAMYCSRYENRLSHAGACLLRNPCLGRC